ncbi:hypothetical protein Dsin_019322 [Dipteronia sinensis]|uniref:Uncharacterized protein n=1 Tax=Dipteronia sinensis TaxID=43782 RepID=A0AAE0A8G3_9ROSI|nr:hypothetical protein Dsin_019322 [Dipteronia sinensis]
MVGALSVVGSSVMESHTGPCLCLDSLPTSVKSGGDLVSRRSSMKRKHVARVGSLELGSSFVDSWPDWRLSSKAISNTVNRKQQRKGRMLVIVNELAGQYEDSFEDVKTQILNYFTYKAVRTVLNQLYEMNPTQYRWFYDFVATNKPGDGKRFIRSLGKVVFMILSALFDLSLLRRICSNIVEISFLFHLLSNLLSYLNIYKKLQFLVCISTNVFVFSAHRRIMILPKE